MFTENRRGDLTISSVFFVYLFERRKKRYYIQLDGSITTNSSQKFIGVAISNTELLLPDLGVTMKVITHISNGTIVDFGNECTVNEEFDEVYLDGNRTILGARKLTVFDVPQDNIPKKALVEPYRYCYTPEKGFVLSPHILEDISLDEKLKKQDEQLLIIQEAINFLLGVTISKKKLYV